MNNDAPWTSRRRLLAVLAGQMPDRVPINTYELAGRNSLDWYNQQPSYRSLMDFIRAHTDCITNWNPRAATDRYTCEERFLCSDYPVEIDSRTEQMGQFERTTRICHTPKGDLVSASEVDPKIYTTWQVEHWCKNTADVEMALSVPHQPAKKITTFVGYHNKVGPGPGWQPMPVPEGFDYQTWLGPAPLAPYHKDRCLYRFRFIYDYSGGQITNFGAHSNDMAQWAMGTDGTGPIEVELLDAKFLPKGSLFDVATETKFRCLYANGVELVCDMDKSQVGARFEGTEGTLQTGYGGITANPESLKTLELGPNDKPLYRSDDHVGNFIECVISRKDPVAPVEVGHRSASVCHLGNIAVRLGNIAVRLGKKKILKWDPVQEHFTNDDDANAMLSRPMRAPWQLPV